MASGEAWRNARIRLAFLALFTSSLPLPASGLEAAEPPHSLADYVVTSWGPQDGPSTSDVYDIWQDRDGFLWFASSAGLVRFDGVAFTAVETRDGRVPDRHVMTVFGASDGSLWAGFANGGGISRIQNGRVTTYGRADGLSGAVVTKIREDRHGTIWAATQSGVHRFSGSRWERIGPETGLTEAAAATLYEDHGGALWVATVRGVFRLDDDGGPGRFNMVDGNSRIRGIRQSSDGRIWITDPATGFRPLGNAPSQHTRGGNGYDLLWDRRGNLWVATLGQGVWFVPPDRAGDISSDVVATWNEPANSAIRCLFEDREGNIWAGGPGGIHKFSPRRAIAMSDVGTVRTLAVAADKSVWAGGDSLINFSKHGHVQYRFTDDLPGHAIQAIHADAAGVLWIATDVAVVRFARNAFSSLPLAGREWPAQVQTLATDSHGVLWINDPSEGVLRWTGGRLTTFDPSPQVHHRDIAAVFADAKQRVWMTLNGGGIGVLGVSDHFELLRSSDAFHRSDSAFFEDHTGTIWFGGGDRLTRFKDGRLVAVDGRNGLQIGRILSIADDEDGYLWIGCREGILRLAKSEFDAAIADPAHRLEYDLFDPTEGFAGLPYMAAAARAGDGKLWFVTTQGLTVIDPQAFRVSRPLPPVRIEGIRANDERFATTTAQRLPPHTTYLLLDYTVPTFSSAGSIQFRYRLEGFDTDWIYAGTRRTAIYTGLPPRTYRFRVQARRSQTAWNQSDAEYGFSIEPTFYQTRWFAALCVAAILLTAAAGWQLRVRKIRRDFKMILDERVRLSREMHDTLLQSLIGTNLQLAALEGEFEEHPTPSSSSSLLRQIRAQVEDGIDQARRSIWNLRSSREGSDDLVAAMRDAGRRAVQGTETAFTLAVKGNPHHCDQDVEHQALRIGREALSNAVRHAHARNISVELCYEPEQLVVRVSDDGCGFDRNTSPRDLDPHCGLLIMQERAAQVGGHVTFGTNAASGTVVEALLPTSVDSTPRGVAS